jgi:hypothetical protein
VTVTAPGLDVTGGHGGVVQFRVARFVGMQRI